MQVDAWMLVVGLFALVGPAIAAVSLFIGRMMERTSSAHKRIDKLEQNLAAEFKATREELRHAIEMAWANCPMAKDHTIPVRRDGSGG